MSYKQKYNNALERARHYYLTGKGEPVDFIKMIFPELVESEDDRIRKDLITFLDDVWYLGKNANFDKLGKADCSNWIAWLEKQSKKNINPTDIKEKAHQIAWETSKDYDPSLSKEAWCEMAALDMASWLEKQGEQPVDKIEPKFKVGDWVVKQDSESFWNGDCVAQIINITERGEHWLNIGCWVKARDIRLWTINDAKDGDVLATEDGRPFIIRCMVESKNDIPSAYCGINARPIERFIITGYSPGTSKWTNYKVHPATKEQRDLLFKKMKEAGYEWDTEKKEVKKIDTYQLNENPCSGCTNTKGCITCVNGDQKSTSTPRMLYSDEVIEWLDDNICNAYDYDGNDISTTLKSKFKQYFRLC